MRSRLLAAVPVAAAMLFGTGGQVALSGSVFTDTATTTATISSGTWGGTSGPVSGNAFDVAVEADHPIGFWRLADGALADGDLAADASGNGNPGTVSGGGIVPASVPSPVTGGHPAARFTGDGSRVVLPAAAGTDGTSPFSAEVWINASTVGARGATAIGYGGSGGWQYALGLAPTGYATLDVYTAGGAHFIANDTRVLTGGGWHLLAGVFDPVAAGGTVSLYVDGALALALTGTGPALLPVAAGTAPTVGSLVKPGGVQAAVSGGLADAAIFPAALSADRIAAHWAAR